MAEYLSEEMQSYFRKNGVQYEFTVRYTPQLNGVAERMNRSLIEKARCMLLGSNLSKNLWSEAVRAATYVLKRGPTKALEGKVPAHLWYGHKPNLTKLRGFDAQPV